MWYWFTRKGEVEEVKSESGDTPLTCSALIDFASTLTANDWAPFLTMTRDHDINTLKQDEVKDLFARYKEDGGVSSDPDVCTPVNSPSSSTCSLPSAGTRFWHLAVQWTLTRCHFQIYCLTS